MFTFCIKCDDKFHLQPDFNNGFGSLTAKLQLINYPKRNIKDFTYHINLPLENQKVLSLPGRTVQIS